MRDPITEPEQATQAPQEPSPTPISTTFEHLIAVLHDPIIEGIRRARTKGDNEEDIYNTIILGLLKGLRP